MKRISARQTIKRLHQIRNHFGPAASDEKSVLLERLDRLPVGSASDVKKMHLALCFIRAFPDSADNYRWAGALLASFESVISALSAAQRESLADSGILATDLHYNFSFDVAAWLARRYPGIAAIDWEALDECGRLDELLEHLLQPAELDFFNGGQVTTQEWAAIATGNSSGTDIDWLFAQLGDRPNFSQFWTSLYNAADIPLRCHLGSESISRTLNVFPVPALHYRHEPMTSRVVGAKRQILQPVRSMPRLSKSDGARLIDVAMSSLAVRHRETNHFNYANPDEVWLADVGKGVSIAVIGLLPEYRYPLECTMGFLILSNGVPIGYGGSSILFRQANTGINIFEEYRGSEAAWLWVQVMRVFHSLSGCNRFIANPYQFGSENSEALRSGAFWFYYRLGYRPVLANIRELAKNEYRKIQAKKGYRTSLAVLRELATCDMHLTLAGARQAEFFDERWIENSAMLATRQLARSAFRSRKKAQVEIARELAVALGIDSTNDWTSDERRWFHRLAPVVIATMPAAWPVRQRRSMISLLRAKGGACERDFVRRFAAHRQFFDALKSACRPGMRT